MNNNTTSLVASLATAVLLLAGCGNGGASFSPIATAAAAPPAFLEEGKTYSFKYAKAERSLWSNVTVQEIDADSGWIRVKYDDGRGGGSYWVNMANVVAIESEP